MCVLFFAAESVFYCNVWVWIYDISHLRFNSSLFEQKIGGKYVNGKESREQPEGRQQKADVKARAEIKTFYLCYYVLFWIVMPEQIKQNWDQICRGNIWLKKLDRWLLCQFMQKLIHLFFYKTVFFQQNPWL